ncbi:MAG: hypothetical protein WC822_02340 [Candidatus Paceibacterota bacterium]
MSLTSDAPAEYIPKNLSGPMPAIRWESACGAGGTNPDAVAFEDAETGAKPGGGGGADISGDASVNPGGGGGATCTGLKPGGGGGITGSVATVAYHRYC